MAHTRRTLCRTMRSHNDDLAAVSETDPGSYVACRKGELT